jgi:hypothetical protein
MAVSIIKSRVIQHAQCRFGLGLDTQIVEGYLLGGLDRTKNPFIQARDCPGIPQRGERHPDDDKLSMQLLEPRPFKNSRDRIWALATYRAIDFDPINAPVIEVRMTTKQVLRCYDSDGNPIKIDYKDPSGNVYPSWAGQIADTVATGILHAEWVEYNDPRKRLSIYKNALNDNQYYGGDRFTWWVADLGVTKVRYQSGYKIVAELHYDAETWLQTIPYRDKFGVIPNGVDLAGSRGKASGSYNGYVRGTLKNMVSFDNLKIPGI